MEVIEVSRRIEHKIKQLGELRDELDKYPELLAKANANYDKEIAKTMIQLRNGVEFIVDGERIMNPPVSIMDKTAKGICWNLSIEKDRVEIEYKNLLKKIDIIESQLNGYQSINRHLSHT